MLNLCKVLYSFLFEKMPFVVLHSCFHIKYAYTFLCIIRQTWPDLLPWVICWILVFSGEQHLQLKWAPSVNIVYCECKQYFLCFFLIFSFVFTLGNAVLMWCSILCGYLSGCSWCSSRVAAYIGSCACRGNYCMSYGV